MSKEVEVTGIKLVASVPEDLQISLGLNTNNALTAGAGLSGTATSNYAVKYNEIAVPDEATNTTDWFNTVDFSEHYIAGKLKPASSTDGRYLFKTADANEQGKAVSRVANFALVTDSDEAGVYRRGSVTNDKITVSGTEYDVTLNTLEAGYYVDFPVWFRTSSKKAGNGYTGTVTALTDDTNDTLELGVIATIKQSTASDATEDLYHAVRVAVIPANDSGSLQLTEGTKGVINDTTAAYYERYSTTNAEATVSSSNLAQALKASGKLVYNPADDKQTNVLDHYGQADTIVQASSVHTDTGYFTVGEPVVKVPLATGDNRFGNATKYVIRVWLEGEDTHCWNETAGQDFDISLRFVMLKSDSNYTDDATIDASTNVAATDKATYDKSINTVTVTCTSLSVTLPGNTTPTAVSTITLTPNASTNDYEISGTDATTQTDVLNNMTGKWYLNKGKSGQVEIANAADLVNYVNEYAKVYDISALTLEQ